MSIYELENFRVSNLKKLKMLKFLLPLFILVSFYDKHTIGSVNFLYFGVGVAVFTSEMKYKFYILGAYLILYIFLFRLNLPNDFTIIFALNISGLLFYCAVFQTTKHEIQNKFTKYKTISRKLNLALPAAPMALCPLGGEKVSGRGREKSLLLAENVPAAPSVLCFAS